MRPSKVLPVMGYLVFGAIMIYLATLHWGGAILVGMTAITLVFMYCQRAIEEDRWWPFGKRDEVEVTNLSSSRESSTTGNG